jgi:hypothetical protein
MDVLYLWTFCRENVLSRRTLCGRTFCGWTFRGRTFRGKTFCTSTNILTVPDMRSQGQLTCLVTGRGNKKKSCNSYMYVYNVSCAHNAKHV